MVDRRSIYLVRHGITEWNCVRRMQGHTDVPLNTEGRVQAALIGARLSAVAPRPTAIWSSDLARAVDTARAIAQPLGLKVQTTPLLRETMLGEWEGLTREEIIARGDSERLEAYLRDSLQASAAGSETLEAVWDRMLRGMDDIRQQCPEETIVIVGHGGSLRALICAALDAPLSMRRLWLDNASLSAIEELQGDEEPMSRVLLINDTSHLTAPAP